MPEIEAKQRMEAFKTQLEHVTSLWLILDGIRNEEGEHDGSRALAALEAPLSRCGYTNCGPMEPGRKIR